MKRDKPSYEELQERLLEAESVLESIRKGKVDLLLGETQPLVIQLKSVTEEKDKLLKLKPENYIGKAVELTE